VKNCIANKTTVQLENFKKHYRFCFAFQNLNATTSTKFENFIRLECHFIEIHTLEIRYCLWHVAFILL